jgi:hypothetical protein
MLRQAFFMSECGAAFTKLRCVMFRVGEIDVSGLKQFDNLLGSLGQDGPKVITRALNRTGDMAKTQVVRALAKQTGLPQKTIRKALRAKRASWQDLEYRLSASGGDVSLKYFKARETRRGVTALVRGELRVPSSRVAASRVGVWP